MKGVDVSPRVLRVAGLYLVFGLLWIFVTSVLVPEVLPRSWSRGTVELVKGSAFVVASAGLISLLVWRDVRSTRAAAGRLQDERRRRETILAHVSDAVFVVGEDETIRWASASCREVTGFAPAELEGTAAVGHFHEDDRERLRAALRRAEKGPGSVREVGARLRRADGTWIDVELSGVLPAGGDVDGLVVTARDVTDRRRAFEELRRKEESLARAQRIARLGSWELDLATGELWWSDETYRIFGAGPGDFDGSYEGFLAFVHPDDRDRMEERQQAVLDGEAPLDLLHRIVRPDGEERIVHERGELSRDAGGEPDRLSGTVQDVTERQELEERVERSRRLLQRYASHVTSVREEERGEIAREIHDDLGQDLTALKLQLERVRRSAAPGDEAARSRIADMQTQIAETVQKVRDLTTYLRPAVLEHLGLVDALDWLGERVAENTGLPCRVRTELGDVPLPPDRAIHVFRVAQEALTNAVRHAGASAAVVELVASDGRLRMRVLDDGKGFAAEELESRDSYGVVGMRERARVLGGTFELRNRSEGGAEVVLEVPLAGGPEAA